MLWIKKSIPATMTLPPQTNHMVFMHGMNAVIYGSPGYAAGNSIIRSMHG
jgi:hypothetical protein